MASDCRNTSSIRKSRNFCLTNAKGPNILPPDGSEGHARRCARRARCGLRGIGTACATARGHRRRRLHRRGARTVRAARRRPARRRRHVVARAVARGSRARLGAERAYAAPTRSSTADDVDVVHICSPNATHAPLATLALEAGKHVVCEKPLATPRREADALVARRARSGRVATVPFVYRFHPVVREARARVAPARSARSA